MEGAVFASVVESANYVHPVNDKPALKSVDDKAIDNYRFTCIHILYLYIVNNAWNQTFTEYSLINALPPFLLDHL